MLLVDEALGDVRAAQGLVCENEDKGVGLVFWELVVLTAEVFIIAIQQWMLAFEVAKEAAGIQLQSRNQIFLGASVIRLHARSLGRHGERGVLPSTTKRRVCSTLFNFATA